MGRVQAKSSEVAKTDASPLPAWDTMSYSPPLGPTEGTAEKEGQEVSAMEQHHHELLCASWSPLGVNAPSRPHLTHSPVCVGQSFVTLPRFRCQKTPAIHCHSQPNSSSPWLEKRSQVYSMSTYTFLLWGFSNWQGSPEPPPPPHPSFPSRVNWRMGRDDSQRGYNMGRPHQGRRMAFSSTFYETKLP